MSPRSRADVEGAVLAVGRLAGLAAAMPKARVVVLPEHGHGVGQYGCLPHLVKLFVDRGSAATLDVRCGRATPPPPFVPR